MKLKSQILAVIGFLFLTVLLLNGCIKDDDGCPDLSLLTNKWWYNVTPPDSAHGISYPSYYYESTGKMKRKKQNGTEEKYAGTWIKIADTCDKLSVYDTTMHPPAYTEKIVELTAHKLKMEKTWTGFGTFSYEYRDTP